MFRWTFQLVKLCPYNYTLALNRASLKTAITWSNNINLMIFWKIRERPFRRCVKNQKSIFSLFSTKYGPRSFPENRELCPFHIWDLSIPSERAPFKLLDNLQSLNMDHQNSSYRANCLKMGYYLCVVFCSLFS